jgi:VWFA-related protein
MVLPINLKRACSVARALFVVALTALSLLAQSPPTEKPKLKDFGESVKRLKWDPKLNAAVETKPANRQARTGDSEDVVKVETSLVVSSVLVLDQRGQPVTGLTANDFLISEEGQPQNVGMFSVGNDTTVPRSIVLIIDYSPSQLAYIHTSIAAAKTLVDKLAPLDRMAIVTDDVELLVDFTRDKNQLKDALTSLLKKAGGPLAPSDKPHRVGLSRQYSALMATLKEAFSNEDERPIVIFQTDGDQVSLLRDTKTVPAVPPDLPRDLRQMAERRVEGWRERLKREQTDFSINDLYKVVEKSRATIYTVVPGFRLIGLSPEAQAAQFRAGYVRWYESDRWKRASPEAIEFIVKEEAKVQASLAVVGTLTGGWTEFLEQPSQADEIYSHIFSDINRRYIVGYYPINKDRDGKRRKLSIEVRRHPEYSVLSRKSYFAPDPND